MATIPVYLGPMKYRPTEKGVKNAISYLGYNWYLCTKHLKAIKKISAATDQNFPKSHIWNKTYHKAMIVSLTIPFIGHIVAVLEAFIHRVDVNKSWLKFEIKPADFKKPEEFDKPTLDHLIQDLVSNPKAAIPDNLKNNKWFAFDAVENVGLSLEIFTPEVKKSFPIALKAVCQNLDAFNHVDETLKKNPDFLLACIEFNGREFFEKFIPPELKNSYAFCLQAIACNSSVYASLPEKFKNQKQMILRAFTAPVYSSKDSPSRKENAALFKLIPKELQEDIPFVKDILRRNGLVLEYLSETIQDNWEWILIAVKNNYHAYQYASERQRKNSVLLLSLININSAVFEHAHGDLKKNKYALLKVLEKNGRMYPFADPSLQSQRDVFVQAITMYGDVFANACDQFKNDLDLAFIGLATDPTVIKYLGEIPCNNEQFVSASVCKWFGSLGYASETLRKNPEIVLKAIRFDGAAFRYAHESLQENIDFVVKVLQECRFPDRAWETLPDTIQKDPKAAAAFQARKGKKS